MIKSFEVLVVLGHLEDPTKINHLRFEILTRSILIVYC